MPEQELSSVAAKIPISAKPPSLVVSRAQYSLCRRRAVDKLPAEVLARIFQSLVNLTIPPWSNRLLATNSLSHTTEWTVVTRVNRAWRAAAFLFPQLWTYITSYPIEDALAQLERSGKVPFSFYHEFGCHTSEEDELILNAALDQQYRVRYLDVTFDLDDGTIPLEVIQQRLANPMPLLQELTIFLEYRTASIIEPIRLGPAPKLHSISLAGGLLFPTSSLLNVTKLELSTGDPFPTRLDPFRLMLEGMPCLRVLILFLPLIYEPGDPTDFKRVDIKLPKLLAFKLTADVHSFPLFTYYARFIVPNLRHFKIRQPRNIYCRCLHRRDATFDVNFLTALPFFLDLMKLGQTQLEQQVLGLQVTPTTVTSLSLKSFLQTDSPRFALMPLGFSYVAEGGGLPLMNICLRLPLYDLKTLSVIWTPDKPVEVHKFYKEDEEEDGDQDGDEEEDGEGGDQDGDGDGENHGEEEDAEDDGGEEDAEEAEEEGESKQTDCFDVLIDVFGFCPTITTVCLSGEELLPAFAARCAAVPSLFPSLQKVRVGHPEYSPTREGFECLARFLKQRTICGKPLTGSILSSKGERFLRYTPKPRGPECLMPSVAPTQDEKGGAM